MRHILTVGIMAWAAAMSASTIDFSYNYTDETPSAYASGQKAQIIDVAIRVDAQGLVGKSITGLSVPVTGDLSLLSAPSVFLTTELKTKSSGGVKYNDPDICSLEASLADGMLDVTFPAPYVIPDNGVYIGYSLTIGEQLPDGNEGPVAVVTGGNEGAFYYHATAMQGKWKDMVPSQGVSSAMIVHIEGDFPAAAVSWSIVDDTYVGVGEGGSVTVLLRNEGTEPIAEVGYSYEVAGVAADGTYGFDNPIPARYGYPFITEIPVAAIDDEGDFTLNLGIPMVNGKENTISQMPSEGKLHVLPFVPVCRPLVEEYTGLRCGWCPGGYVSLAEMTERYGHDTFVAMAYHGSSFENGAMVCLDEFPWYPSGYPASQINRNGSTDVLKIPAVWEQARKTIPVGDLEISLAFADEERYILRAECNTRFVRDMESAGYKMAFALVADGLTDPEWAQYNAYSMDPEKYTNYTGKYWDLFVGKDLNVYGLVFDEVAVYFPDQKGIAGSLPENITKGEKYRNVFEVDTRNVVNVIGEHIVKDFGKTRVIGMILDSKTGYVLNCASSPYPSDYSSVDMTSDSVISSTEYYDMRGVRVAFPSEGIHIRVDRLADGSIRTSKVMK